MTWITVACCQLNQWALDFEGNLERIVRSCQIAQARGATYRVGPELELCGYGCEDHFLELDTVNHSWDLLIDLLVTHKAATYSMLCDFGMPLVAHGNRRYNCRVLCYQGKILLIRPKTALADDGNYRESRYFTAYSTNNNNSLEQYVLPPKVQKALGQVTVPFGVGSISSLADSHLGISCESCEELWTPQSSNIAQSALATTSNGASGVTIVANGSGSHHELRKWRDRQSLIQSATFKAGGLYLYANQRGCDGSARLYFDGMSSIHLNGQLLVQAPQFSLQDITVLTATVNTDDVIAYRTSVASLGVQAQQQSLSSSSSAVRNASNTTIFLPATTSLACPSLQKSMDLVQNGVDGKGPEEYHIFCTTTLDASSLKIPIPPTPEQECCLGPACWLWDYLRRSGAAGFFLALSGGADSSAVATIVGQMCRLVMDELPHNPQVQADVKRILLKHEPANKQENNDDFQFPKTPQELASKLLTTAYMSTRHSSRQTTNFASTLAQQVGSTHWSFGIDTIVTAFIQVVIQVTSWVMPRFVAQGGNLQQDLALQNLQARIRMVVSYIFAQLAVPNAFLLVLTSSNVDEGLRGYMTKYDCSSGDLNPIGAISKLDLRRMLLSQSHAYPILKDVAHAPPTAELRPSSNSNDGDEMQEQSQQLDEEEMGMTYSELSWFGKLRQQARCGPVSMYCKLRQIWHHLDARQIAIKVQRFFVHYSRNRHKMCTVTPSYHAESYSPDDNRFDLRPFLYNTSWSRQFATMNDMVTKEEEKEEETNRLGTEAN